MFLKEVSYAPKGCIYLIKNIVKEKYSEIFIFIITVFYLIIF